MSNPTDRTTLVSLFHTDEQASKALSDLRAAGIPQQSIQTLGGVSRSSAPEQSLATLKTLNLPTKDLQILSEGLKSGGTLIVVRAEEAYADKVEDVFERHHANQIDERSIATQPKAPATQAKRATADAVIPIVEEELVVGKRKVERGGVRVFSHVVETPVEEKVVLREEHATVERHAVNRPVSEADFDKLQNQSIEVHEMAEEAVVGKTARVVEEVYVGKETTDRTQQVKDTIRKTQLEVEQVAPDAPKAPKGKK